MYRTILIVLLLLTVPIIVRAEISANHWAGSVIIGPDNALCNNVRRGAIRYESIKNFHEYCDGTEWKRFVSASDSGDPSTPAASTGYFVLSAGTWTGNLGGRAGADNLCLTDLTNNDWKNKTDAVSRGLLIPSRVKAFICTDTTTITCNNALPLTTYTFAVSGNSITGGASFVTDSNGRGPGNTQNWAGTNYFGTDARYWANRGAVSASLWADVGQTAPGSAAVCSGFSVSSPSWNGNTGNANNTGSTRWDSILPHCGLAQHLICMVHP